MPLYDFFCSNCNKTKELLLLSSTDNIKCPECGNTKIEKLVSATSSITGRNHHSTSDSNSTCCGNTPEDSSCEGPGSCCGRTF